MEKEDFLKKLAEETGYSKEVCFKINEILESHFFVGKSSKDKIENDLKEKLSFSEGEANNIYNIIMDIFSTCVKDKASNHFNL